jgi:hypothetical protein
MKYSLWLSICGFHPQTSSYRRAGNSPGGISGGGGKAEILFGSSAEGSIDFVISLKADFQRYSHGQMSSSAARNFFR